jgi:Ca-activated chloride channel homolog
VRTQGEASSQRRGGIFAACLAVAALSPVARTTGQDAFRSRVDLVNVAVTVSDKKGALIQQLTPDDFELYEDGAKQVVRYFAAGAAISDAPVLHLGLLLDVSESMGEDLRFSKTASIKFLNTLTDAADVTVVDFDTEVRTARYSQNDFPRLIERIRLKKAGGSTALYDAIGTYLDGAAGQDGRKVMLLYTDGGDTHSSMQYHELVDLLKASDVTVYAIGELEHQSSSTKSMQRALLQQIADVTGGQAFFPVDVKELDKVYEKVVAQIRAQYTLGYLSTNDKADGTWRKVEVRLTRKDGHDLRLRSRKGYFARYQK